MATPSTGGARTAMREKTDLVVGLLAFIFHDFHRAVTLNLFGLDIDNITGDQDPTFVTFRERVPDRDISNEQLIHWGKHVKLLGTNSKPILATFYLIGRRITAARAATMDKDWDKFDNIYSSARSFMQSSHFNRLTTNLNNSCAFEAAVHAGRRARLGLQQGDGMSIQKIRTMTRVQQLYYICCTVDVRKMKDKQFERLIDMFMQATSEKARGNTYRYGQMVDINDIFGLVLAPYDSMSYVCTDMHVCCEIRVLRIDRDLKRFTKEIVHNITLEPQRTSRLYPGCTIEEIINLEWFSAKSTDDSNLRGGDPISLRTRCRLGKRCKQLIRTRRVLLTDIGGWFLLNLAGGVSLGTESIEERKPFADKIITYTTSSGEFSALFKVVVAIFNISGVHFITRMNGLPGENSGIKGHDGTRLDALTPHRDWMQGINTNTTTLCALFMERGAVEARE